MNVGHIDTENKPGIIEDCAMRDAHLTDTLSHFLQKQPH